jgi:hypothetical protein
VLVRPPTWNALAIAMKTQSQSRLTVLPTVLVTPFAPLVMPVSSLPVMMIDLIVRFDVICLRRFKTVWG